MSAAPRLVDRQEPNRFRGTMYHVAGRMGTRIRAGFLGLVFLAGCASPRPLDRAMQQIRTKNEPQAIAILRADLERHPEGKETRTLLIKLYANSGRLDLARAEVKELQRWVPADDPSPLIVLGHAYELAHKFEEALASYDEAAARSPNSPTGPREGGMRAARWGEAEVALERLLEAERRGAHDAELLHTLGLVKMKLGDLEGAREAYTRGADEDPKRIDCLLGLATVALKAGDAPAVLLAYERVLVREPNLAVAELGRAWALAKLGRVPEAKRALDRAESLGAPKANIDKQRAALRE